MFFSFLFKNKKGNKEVVEKTLFRTAVVLNIVGFSIAGLIILLGIYKEYVDFYRYIGWAVITVAITFIAELILAALASNNAVKEVKEVKKAEEVEAVKTPKKTSKKVATKKKQS